MIKLADAPLADVLNRCSLSDEARAAIDGADAVPLITERLVAHGFLIEAARVFAHALPHREAVWWACMCALHTAPPNLSDADRHAREMAELWVRKQSEELRRGAMAEAEKAGFQSPEAWAAVGAFWSGPSIAPANAIAVPPAPHLAGLAVAGAMALSAVRRFPERQEFRLTQFLASARDIAAGGSGRLTPEAA
jgi:hypothetical protein